MRGETWNSTLFCGFARIAALWCVAHAVLLDSEDCRRGIAAVAVQPSSSPSANVIKSLSLDDISAIIGSQSKCTQFAQLEPLWIR